MRQKLSLRLHHHAWTVDDQEATRRFHEDVIGLPLPATWSEVEDRRSALLTATPAAVARLREWQARRGALVREQVARLSESDRASLAAAVPALRRLAENLHEEVEGP
ncbi:hypothetical protein ACFZCY_19435 [Streptomyces sp. NPDC007983]|uniref:hypothetical protein n=1 Tax=Streptomyces sp. NPDC007983 TaxID=3364800 RepID=UPI0036E82854